MSRSACKGNPSGHSPCLPSQQQTQATVYTVGDETLAERATYDYDSRKHRTYNYDYYHYNYNDDNNYYSCFCWHKRFQAHHAFLINVAAPFDRLLAGASSAMPGYEKNAYCFIDRHVGKVRFPNRARVLLYLSVLALFFFYISLPLSLADLKHDFPWLVHNKYVVTITRSHALTVLMFSRFALERLCYGTNSHTCAYLMMRSIP